MRRINALGVSPDENLLAAAVRFGKLAFATLPDGQFRSMRSAYKVVNLTQFAWSPDATELATAGMDGNIVVWNTVRDSKFDLYFPGEIRAIEWAAPDQLLVASSNRVFFVDLFESRRSLKAGDGATIQLDTLSWSNDGELFVPAGEKLYRWSPGDKAMQLAYEASGRIVSAEVSPNGKRVAILPGYNVPLTVVDLEKKEVLWEHGKLDSVRCFGWSPDGSKIAVGGKLLLVFESDTGTPLFEIENKSRETGLSWSPDGQRLATLSDDGTPRIWDSRTGDMIASGPAGDLTPFTFGIEWAPGGDRFATVTIRDGVTVWTVEGDALKSQEFKGSTLGAVDIDWCPDGSRIATLATDELRLIDSNSGTVTFQYRFEPGRKEYTSQDMAWSPDGKTIAFGMFDWGEVHWLSASDWRPQE